MADAYARLTGEVGVAMVTGGPGHANAVSALYTAAMAESPVVLLSGHAPLAELGTAAFQEMRQAEMAAVVTKASGVCTAAANAGGDFVKAARVAKAGRYGPVHLSLPTDVLEGDSGDTPQAQVERAQYPAINAQPAVDRIAAAKRPVILCGPMCLTREGRRRMAALEAASGTASFQAEYRETKIKMAKCTLDLNGHTAQAIFLRLGRDEAMARITLAEHACENTTLPSVDAALDAWDQIERENRLKQLPKRPATF